MTRSLTWKLTLAFLLVALTVALLLAVLLRLSNASQLDQLIIEQQRGEYRTLLAGYYQAHGSWEGVWEYVIETRAARFFEPTRPPDSGEGDTQDFIPEFRRDRREMFGLADASGLVIIPLLPNYPAGEMASLDVLAAGDAVVVNGQTVGTILTAARPPGLNTAEQAFLRRANVAILLASGGALLVALVVALLLARTLTRPLQALTQAAHRMAGGELEQAVPVRSADEIGQLAQAFNVMSREVARAHLTRKQLTADIAHELRTPLTVIAGYVEAMRDGALAATPERLATISIELDHLQQLVNDLRTLSLADTGELQPERQPIAPRELLEQARAAFEHQAAQKDVVLEVRAEAGLPPVQVDEARLAQVLGNLLGNALRHTPPGGRITLEAAAEGGGVSLGVRDTGPGIPAEDLPFIFNRFYRGDASRTGENGEAGLGLAIARALVEAHGGTIEAQSSPGSGATLLIHLPGVPLQH